ncbi:MAG: thioredoxin family protein [Thermoleophilia bacterium]|nr:thioredoxin family protein [Thermoleophilia bacterium]
MSDRDGSSPAEANGSARPRLLFFHSPRSGPSRRVEGFLAQVLQRRGNHRTFHVYRVAHEERPDLTARFAIEEVPTLVVVEGKRVRGKLGRPRGCDEIESFLAPWLK